ncbi:MAG: hypothetical protein ACOCXQ_01935 [Patescibacteria group bacterium]
MNHNYNTLALSIKSKAISMWRSVVNRDILVPKPLTILFLLAMVVVYPVFQNPTGLNTLDGVWVFIAFSLFIANLIQAMMLIIHNEPLKLPFYCQIHVYGVMISLFHIILKLFQSDVIMTRVLLVSGGFMTMYIMLLILNRLFFQSDSGKIKKRLAYIYSLFLFGLYFTVFWDFLRAVNALGVAVTIALMCKMVLKQFLFIYKRVSI